MPIFEYHCSSCDHRFEKIQKSSASRPAPCPQCGEAAKRLASAPAIQFKGTGWYITDYARKGGGAPAGEKGGEEKSGGTDKGDTGSKESTETKATESKTAKDEKAPAKPAAPTKSSRGKKRD